MTFRKQQFGAAQLSEFCGQLSLLLRTGISFSDSVSLLEQDADELTRKVCASLLTPLENAESLSFSMRQSGFFPEYACQMVQLAELSGTTDEVLDSLSSHYAREAEISEALRSAVAYPFLMICMMAAVVIVILTKVLPVFDQVFSQMGSGLIGLSYRLLQLGQLLEDSAFVLTLLLLLLVCAVLLFKTVPALLPLGQKLFISIPPVRRLLHKIDAGRFADGLSIALSSGLSFEESLTLSASLISSPDLLQSVQKGKEALENGASLSDALAACCIFSATQVKMIGVGCRTGFPEKMLRRIARQNFEESDAQICRMIGILEPSIVAVLCCVVGMILLSVMLPLLGILSGLS